MLYVNDICSCAVACLGCNDIATRLAAQPPKQFSLSLSPQPYNPLIIFDMSHGRQDLVLKPLLSTLREGVPMISYSSFR